MSYVDQSLGENERVHYRAHFPAIRYWLAAGIFLLGMVLTGLAVLRGAPGSGFSLLLFSAAISVAIMYEVWTTEIAVTTQRLVYSRGLFQRSTNELQVKAIEEVRLEQDFLGRIFNYGRLNFHGTGVDDLNLPALGDPITFQKAMQEAIGAKDTPPVEVEVKTTPDNAVVTANPVVTPLVRKAS